MTRRIHQGTQAQECDDMKPPQQVIGSVLSVALDKAVDVHQPVIDAYLRRARQRRPEATPAELITSLERQYLAAVTALGGAGGAVAAMPGPWSPGAFALNIAEVSAFLDASACFVLAVAEVHGVRVDDLNRRRTLLVAILLGNSGATFVQEAAGRTAPHWGRMIVKGIPMSAIRNANKVLGRNFVTKFGTKQGVLVLGRSVPFGLGALIGSAGNAALGRTTIAAARTAFGPAPAARPEMQHPNT